MSRCAVVTGASQGVGLSVTQLLLEHGWTVYTHYRTAPAAINHPNVHWWGRQILHKISPQVPSRS